MNVETFTVRDTPYFYMGLYENELKLEEQKKALEEYLEQCREAEIWIGKKVAQVGEFAIRKERHYPWFAVCTGEDILAEVRTVELATNIAHYFVNRPTHIKPFAEMCKTLAKNWGKNWIGDFDTTIQEMFVTRVFELLNKSDNALCSV